MSKSKPKIQVVTYHMSMQIGVVLGPVDAFHKIQANKKTMWEGFVDTNQTISIVDRELFGGLRKEGGVRGDIHFLLGGPAQTMSAFLCEKLNRTTTTCPFNRGLASIFLTETPGAATEGMELQANNPNIPQIAVEVSRYSDDWYAEKSTIPRPGQITTELSEVAEGEYDLSGSQEQSAMLDFEGRRYWKITNGTGTGGEDELHEYSMEDNSLTQSQNLDWDSLATGHEGHAVYHYGDGLLYIRANSSGAVRGVVVNPADATLDCSAKIDWGTDSAVFDVDGVPHIIKPSFGLFRFSRYSGGTETFLGTAGNGGTGNYIIMGFREKSGETDVIFAITTSDEVFTITITAAGAVGTETLAFDPGHAISAALYDYSDGTILLNAGTGDFYKYSFDDGLYTEIWHNDSTPGAGLVQLPSPAQTRIVSRVAMAYSLGTNLYWFSTETGELLHTQTRSAVSASTRFYGDDVGGAFWSTVGAALWRWQWEPLASSRCFDSNPAHIIYEVLTDTEFGMGVPAASLDSAAFTAAADTLFDEELGLSLLWVQQATGEQFVQEIIDHIEGVVYVDPNTGLLVLKLIRGDYDPATLPVLNRSNATIENFRRKGLGETINQLTVTWTNPENEEEETVTLQEPGNIAAQGNIVNDDRNYYGVRSSRLALQLARRDLRVGAYPLATLEAVLSNENWDVVPGQVFALDWTFRNGDSISRMAVRITEVDRNHKGKGKIRVKLAEDIFALEAAEFTELPGGEELAPGEEPAELEFIQFISLPYYFGVNLISAGVTFDETAEESFFGILGATTSTDTVQYDVLGQEGGSLGSDEYVSFGYNTLIPRSVLDVALVEEIETTLSGGFPSPTSGPSAVAGTFVVISDGPEEDQEIAIVTSVTPNIVMQRGMLDTTPRAWPISTPVWLIHPESDIVDDEPYAAPQSGIKYKLLTVTSLGTLSQADASEQSVGIEPRHYLPLRPANVKVETIGFGSVDGRGLSNLDVTWNRRNRLTEDSVVNYWDDADVTPEASTTVTVQALNLAKDTVLGEDTGLSGTSHTFAVSNFGAENEGYVRVISERGGDESWQGHDIYVYFDVIGTGAITTPVVLLGGIAGAGDVVGFGNISTTVPTLSGTGTIVGIVTGSGAIDTTVPTLAGTGHTGTVVGSGAIDTTVPTLAGTGTVTGSGADFLELEGTTDRLLLEGGTDKLKLEE